MCGTTLVKFVANAGPASFQAQPAFCLSSLEWTIAALQPWLLFVVVAERHRPTGLLIEAEGPQLEAGHLFRALSGGGS